MVQRPLDGANETQYYCQQWGANSTHTFLVQQVGEPYFNTTATALATYNMQAQQQVTAVHRAISKM